jgi:iron complex transport system substrate-binding protein
MKTWKTTGSVILAVIMVMLTVLTGCGANNGNGVQATAEAPASQPAATATEQTAEQSNGTQKVKHAAGETEIPLNPAKVVVLDNGALDNLLALGLKPVGAPSIISIEDGFASYLDNTDGITNIGTVEQPSLETIASLKPDLIIGIKDTQEAIYDQLSQIAPTVFTEVGGALVTGKIEEGDKLIADIDARIADFKAQFADQLATTEISLLRPRKDRVSIYLSPSYTGGVAAYFGVKRPEWQQRDDDFNYNVTDEQIDQLDGDMIILFGRESEKQYFDEKIKANPLWNTLKAVQDDKVYQANWVVWLSGHGIHAVNLMLDDLISFLKQ